MNKLLKNILHDDKSSGLLLIVCTVISLLIANSAFSQSYAHFWHVSFFGLSIEHWINDGLMAVFFLYIGLELEREIYIGEFSKFKNAILPVAAAIGGMLIPASIYFLFNKGTETFSGIGIPMATDIAFALGIISLLGKRVPTSLKLFLLALAVIDDLGAIIVIAVFYTKNLSVTYLLIALAIYGVLIIFNWLKIYKIPVYVAGGLLMWFFMLLSGVHATIAGVMLAFVIPFRRESTYANSPSFIILRKLHIPVSFVILPIFALANTAITISGDWQEIFKTPMAVGIMAGLALGKPLGITSACFLVVKLKLASLPKMVNWKNIIGVGFLGGIGFTMSIFISLLAFEDADMINNAKLIVLFTSLFAGIAGYGWLRMVSKQPVK